MLKEELRSMDRARKREGVDMTYLKNVVLKLLETGKCLRCSLDIETSRVLFHGRLELLIGTDEVIIA